MREWGGKRKLPIEFVIGFLFGVWRYSGSSCSAFRIAIRTRFVLLFVRIEFFLRNGEFWTGVRFLEGLREIWDSPSQFFGMGLWLREFLWERLGFSESSKFFMDFIVLRVFSFVPFRSNARHITNPEISLRRVLVLLRLKNSLSNWRKS